MIKFLLCSALIRLLSQIAKIRKKNILRKCKTRKTLFQQPETMLMLLKLEIMRNRIIKVKKVLQLLEEKLFYKELFKTFKKLAPVLAIFVLLNNMTKKTLEYVFYIHYFVWFYNVEVNVLLDNNSKINSISSRYIEMLRLMILKINIRA